jgi:hypothetical protein
MRPEQHRGLQRRASEEDEAGRPDREEAGGVSSRQKTGGMLVVAIMAIRVIEIQKARRVGFCGSLRRSRSL